MLRNRQRWSVVQSRTCSTVSLLVDLDLVLDRQLCAHTTRDGPGRASVAFSRNDDEIIGALSDGKLDPRHHSWHPHSKTTKLDRLPQKSCSKTRLQPLFDSLPPPGHPREAVLIDP